MARKGIPILISAPSGAGKTSLVAALVEQLQHLQVSVSHTTRPMRKNEADGVNYHFISEEQFQSKIRANDFLEYANVFDNYYGTSKSWLQQFLQLGNDVILEIDWQGAQQVRKQFPEAISIFIFPPSIAVLEQRLHQRGQDKADVIDARMTKARDEMSHYIEFDYLVINDDFQVALTELKSIIVANRLLRKRVEDHYGNEIQKMLIP